MRSALMLVLVISVLGCAAEATESMPAANASATHRLAGTVLETLDVANYTYVRFETADGEAWAAVPQAAVEVGAQVAIANPQAMTNFESKTLGRTFDTIYFGTLDDGRGSSAHGGTNPHGATPAGIEVARADGPSGRTVAELHGTAETLAGQTVTLRGKVVKYNAGILGRNWFHLQDGSGDPGEGTHDITVTSSAETAVGAVVVVRGKVAVDKDFGAGYRYSVIVEDAMIE